VQQICCSFRLLRGKRPQSQFGFFSSTTELVHL